MNPTLIRSVTIAVIFGHFLCVSSLAYAESYKHPTLGFSIEIPEQFERVDVQSKGVALVLREKSSTGSPDAKERFPTLTVTVHPGILSLDGAYITQRIEEVLSSYRSIGFPRVEEISHDVRKEQESPYLLLNLRYPRQESQIFRSVVALFPAGKAHFILTFIERESDLEHSLPQINAILSSFKPSQVAPPRPKKPQPRDRWSLLAFVFFGSLVLAGLVGYQTRKHLRS